MTQLSCHPATPASSDGPPVQTIRLTDGKTPIGWATWHVTAPGIIQLIELRVLPKYQRKGHGSALLKAVVDQAKKSGLRKMWAPVGQTSHLLARAFFTSHGFHHISTTSDLLRGEDVLIYVKSWV